jgi:hypothetical protein
MKTIERERERSWKLMKMGFWFEYSMEVEGEL